MFSFYDFIAMLAAILRMLGMLVFGISAGWFTLYAFRQPERRWQLQIAVFLGFFLLAGLTFRFGSAAGVGSFSLGAGAALLFWGLKKDQAEATDDAQVEEDEDLAVS